MNKTGGELSILGDVPPSLSKEFNTSITDGNSIIIHDTNTSNSIDKTINGKEAVSNSIIDNNTTAIINSIDREEEKVSQIVNSALEKARSSRADDESDINAMMDNFITVTEIPTPTKSPKIQSSNLVVPPKSPSRIIQVESNELPILESNLQSNESTSSQVNIGESDGEINNNDTTTMIHIGKIGNPIGSLGTLWDSVTTEQEMVNVNVNIGDNSRGDGEFMLVCCGYCGLLLDLFCVCGGIVLFLVIYFGFFKLVGGYSCVDCYFGINLCIRCVRLGIYLVFG